MSASQVAVQTSARRKKTQRNLVPISQTYHGKHRAAECDLHSIGMVSQGSRDFDEEILVVAHEVPVSFAFLDGGFNIETDVAIDPLRCQQQVLHGREPVG